MDKTPPKRKYYHRPGVRPRVELPTTLRLQIKRIETRIKKGETCVECDMWFSLQEKGNTYADSHELPMPYTKQMIEDVVREKMERLLLGQKPEEKSDKEWQEINPLLFCVTGQGNMEHNEKTYAEAVSRGYTGMTLKRDPTKKRKQERSPI